jgi:hypothetical protein
MRNFNYFDSAAKIESDNVTDFLLPLTLMSLLKYAKTTTTTTTTTNSYQIVGWCCFIVKICTNHHKNCIRTARSGTSWCISISSYGKNHPFFLQAGKTAGS